MFMASQVALIAIIFSAILAFLILKHYFIKLTTSKQNPHINKIKKSKSSASEDGLGSAHKTSENYSSAVILLSKKDELIFATSTLHHFFELEEEITQKDLKIAKIFKINKDEPTDIFTIVENYSNELQKWGEYTMRATVIMPHTELPVKIHLESGGVSAVKIISISDLQAEEDLSKSREMDLLTKLPNQNRAFQDIAIFLNKMNSQNKSFALILTSLDNFTGIRAFLGYQKTDQLIVEIADYLTKTSQNLNSSLFQITNSIFLLAVPDIATAGQARDCVRELDRHFKGLQTYSQSQIHLTFSTGVSIYPFSGNTVGIMLDSAYKALSSAEAKGGGYLVIDDQGDFSKNKHYEAELYHEMFEGLNNKEFELYYQPIVDIASGKIIGAEALIRWENPTRGSIPPSTFIPIAENSGLIIKIGKFVINEAIKQQKKWEMFKFPKLQISINLSLREIETGETAAYIAQKLQEHQVDPSSIKFEMTESVAMNSLDIAKKEFEALKELGVQLALDDFGTGHSSFAYLKDFKLDTLKIDKSFVTNMIKFPEHQKIVQAMIAIGHSFDLQVTAEGIEDRETYQRLKEYGCDTAQGYYISKPLPLYEFQQLIREKI